MDFPNPMTDRVRRFVVRKLTRRAQTGADEHMGYRVVDRTGFMADFRIFADKTTGMARPNKEQLAAAFVEASDIRRRRNLCEVKGHQLYPDWPCRRCGVEP